LLIARIESSGGAVIAVVAISVLPLPGPAFFASVLYRLKKARGPA
jgi:hypothetical protein